MLRELAAGDRTVGQLGGTVRDFSLAAASKHIKALENAGLIRREVHGRTHMCRLDPGPLANAQQWLALLRAVLERSARLLEQLLRKENARKPPPAEKEMTMNDPLIQDTYGVLTEPATVKIERILPGPIERVWAYLTESELRRQWLAAGEMEMKVGVPLRTGVAE